LPYHDPAQALLQQAPPLANLFQGLEHIEKPLEAGQHATDLLAGLSTASNLAFGVDLGFAQRAQLGFQLRTTGGIFVLRDQSLLSQLKLRLKAVHYALNLAHALFLALSQRPHLLLKCPRCVSSHVIQCLRVQT